jgi:hypothetical protein
MLIDKQKEKKTKRYDVALSTRNFEIELFWKRSLFFWGFIASAFVGYATLVKYESSLAIVLACFGFICSFAWTLVNRGSKRWQENWEILVSEMEKNITGTLFNIRREKKENKCYWLRARAFSVSKITIALSDFTVIIWLSLMIYELMKFYSISLCILSSNYPLVLVSGSIVFAIAMLFCGKSSD